MSSAPGYFILNSDFATLKNDDNGTMTITIAAGTIAGGATYTVESTSTLGSTNASVRAYMVASNASTKYCVGSSMTFAVNVTQAGATYDFSACANLERASSSTIRLYCNIPNFSPSDTLTINSSVTITAKISTFLSPFV